MQASVLTTVIDDAIIAPGHDGEAVLVVRVRHENGEALSMPR